MNCNVVAMLSVFQMHLRSACIEMFEKGIKMKIINTSNETITAPVTQQIKPKAYKIIKMYQLKLDFRLFHVAFGEWPNKLFPSMFFKKTLLQWKQSNKILLFFFNFLFPVFWGYHKQGSCQAGLSAAITKVNIS